MLVSWFIPFPLRIHNRYSRWTFINPSFVFLPFIKFPLIIAYIFWGRGKKGVWLKIADCWFRLCKINYSLCPTERLWSQRDSTSQNITLIALPRLQNFRCLLNRRGVPAAPVTNYYARRAPVGPGSCYEQ